ncbi:hypothetical protein ACQP2H_22820 [Micromonospora sp. CA-248260]|uniref:hypothetical protein n=1 Tax=Micromonospora sp. CA-248260 TaxID=3239962 RepID=UPI003D927EEA
MVVVLAVSQTYADLDPQWQHAVGVVRRIDRPCAVVVGRRDAGAARAAVRAVDDGGAGAPGPRRTVDTMTRPSKPTPVTSHPDWCTPERCGYLVPPVMAHMARRHRGHMLRVGEKRASGLVVTYLISAEAPGGPLVCVHASCRAGNAWAELSLPEAAELVEQLRGLLAQAGGQGAGDE